MNEVRWKLRLLYLDIFKTSLTHAQNTLKLLGITSFGTRYSLRIFEIWVGAICQVKVDI